MNCWEIRKLASRHMMLDEGLVTMLAQAMRWFRTIVEFWKEPAGTIKDATDIVLFGFSLLALVFGVQMPDLWNPYIRLFVLLTGFLGVLYLPARRFQALKEKLLSSAKDAERAKVKKLNFRIGKNYGRTDSSYRSYGDICFWYRVEVTTDEPQGVTDACARLLRVRHQGQETWSGTGEALLTFEPGEQSDAVAKRIVPRAVFNLDIVYITSAGRINIAVFKRAWRHEPTNIIFPRPGMYALDILVCATEMDPTEICVLFNWTGKWDSSELHIA